MATYTTVAKVQRRLPGRLNLSAPSSAFGAAGVDPEFVADMITQCEAMVDSHLRQRYQYPLKLSSPETVAVLGAIVERLVAAEIVDSYYWNEEQAGGLAKRFREHAMLDLEAIASGDRTLAGELATKAGSSRVPSYTFVGKRQGQNFDQSYDITNQRYTRGR